MYVKTRTLEQHGVRQIINSGTTRCMSKHELSNNTVYVKSLTLEQHGVRQNMNSRTIRCTSKHELWNNTVYIKPVTSQVSFRHEQIFFTDKNSYKKILGKTTSMKNDSFNCIFWHHYENFDNAKKPDVKIQIIHTLKSFLYTPTPSYDYIIHPIPRNRR